ncbi:MAG: hypothetical protein KIT36_22525 [Alphaproteobacteria bacterium]|nr:hypothetical protein [Alphaproteobacteria bacterium]
MLRSLATPEDVSRTDGRVLRGIRTRQCIVRTTRELFLIGPREPTLEEIARTAGVSPRIVMKYFGSVGGVVTASTIDVLDEVAARYAVFPKGLPLEARIAAYIDLRAEVCEGFCRLWVRTVQMSRLVPEMAGLIRRGRGDMRAFVADVFADEFRRVPYAMQRDLFDEVCLVSDWNNWRYLREACERTPEESKALLRRLLWRLLTV